jgi:hypothetical protein
MQKNKSGGKTFYGFKNTALKGLIITLNCNLPQLFCLEAA